MLLIITNSMKSCLAVYLLQYLLSEKLSRLNIGQLPCLPNAAGQGDFFIFVCHCVKSVRIRSFSGPYLPTF